MPLKVIAKLRTLEKLIVKLQLMAHLYHADSFLRGRTD